MRSDRFDNVFFDRCSRRQALQFIGAAVLTAAGLAGCEKKYEHRTGRVNLGEIKELLYSQQFVSARAMIVNRDNAGWSAMSTLCTYDGCELSMQTKSLRCPCCNSIYALDGQVASGPAVQPLPYSAIIIDGRNLYADLDRDVDAAYRFTTPDVERAISALRERIQREGARPGTKIPNILLGRGDGEAGGMFVEQAESSSSSALFEEGVVAVPEKTPGEH